MNAIRRAYAWILSNRHHLLSASFLVGFVVDNLTLNRLDSVGDNIILATYTLLMMLSTLVLYASMAGKTPERITPFLRTMMPYLMQFAFGGLLSGMLIFYSRSGSWASSWPFLVIILSVIAGNELLSRRADRLLFNLSVLFIGLFSYTILLVPVLTGRMGDVVFVISSIIALLIFIGFVRVLTWVVPNFMTLHLRALTFIIGALFAGMQFLYFANLIPPIPLSLKDIGIYHGVERLQDGRYLLTYQDQSWWRFGQHSDKVFTMGSGQPAYCYSSVFAPARLSTGVVHEWQYKDPANGDWVTRATIDYQIAGGRAEGYRGYSYIANYAPGKWRCVVRTERGQVIGYTTFTVRAPAPGAVPKELQTIVK